MLKLQKPSPIKLFAGILLAKSAPWEQTLSLLEKQWGSSDFIAAPLPFDFTNYYEPEMGRDLQRQFVSFGPLARAEDLPRYKLEANEIEVALLVDNRRTVNIDVGYLDVHKIVLASTKEGPRRVYLGQGIWADLTLHYRKGAFHPFPWTFMDFKAGIYDATLLRMRELYKAQLHQCATATESV